MDEKEMKQTEIDADLHRRMKALAATVGLPMYVVVNAALREYLIRNEHETREPREA